MMGPAIRHLCADACFLLNLVATGCGKEILEGVDLRLLSHREVMSEALYLVEWAAEGHRIQAPVDLGSLAPLLEARDLNDEGRGVLVAAAAFLTDRDATAVALAVQASVPLATDDRRIRRIVAEHFPELPLVSTLEVLKDATERMKMSTTEAGDLLRCVRDRGNFAPPRDDPLSDWYSDVLSTPNPSGDTDSSAGRPRR